MLPCFIFLRRCLIFRSIDTELGREVGLSGADIISNSKDCRALPNQSLSMVLVEIFVRSKEVARYEVGVEIMLPARISSFSKRALRDSKAMAEASIAIIWILSQSKIKRTL